MAKPPHSQRGRRPKPQVGPVPTSSPTARYRKSEIVAGVVGLASWLISAALQLSGIQSPVAACVLLAIGAVAFICAMSLHFDRWKVKFWASVPVVLLAGMGVWWFLKHPPQPGNCPPGTAICDRGSSHGVIKNFTIHGNSYPNAAIDRKDSDTTIKDFDIDDGKKKDATK